MHAPGKYHPRNVPERANLRKHTRNQTDGSTHSCQTDEAHTRRQRAWLAAVALSASAWDLGCARRARVTGGFLRVSVNAGFTAGARVRVTARARVRVRVEGWGLGRLPRYSGAFSPLRRGPPYTLLRVWVRLRVCGSLPRYSGASSLSRPSSTALSMSSCGSSRMKRSAPTSSTAAPPGRARCGEPARNSAPAAAPRRVLVSGAESVVRGRARPRAAVRSTRAPHQDALVDRLTHGADPLVKVGRRRVVVVLDGLVRRPAVRDPLEAEVAHRLGLDGLQEAFDAETHPGASGVRTHPGVSVRIRQGNFTKRT
eukprot:2252769-Prymnesium_polylepis.1